MFKIVYFLISVLLIISCSKDSILSNDDTSQLIVEGWIESGNHPIVILTRSIEVYKEPIHRDNLNDYLIKWATVTVSNGTDSVILTGKYDEGYFPPYIYTTGHLIGEAGKTYKLSVKYRDYYATATTSIPEVPYECKYVVKKCDGSESLYKIEAIITDNPKEKNYYQFFTRIGTKTKQFNASYLGSIDDMELKENTLVPVYRGRKWQLQKYSPYYLGDEIVHIKFAQIDETSFRIWDSLTKNISLSDNMFLSTNSNMVSNIVGGLGYWCGYGAITKTIFVSTDSKDD